MSSPFNSGQPSGGSDSSGSSSVHFGDTSTADSIVSSARNERDDFHLGDDRAIGSPPNWPAYSSRELYDGAVNNNEPGTAEELGAQWNGQGQDLLTAADTLYEAITELSGAWVGRGSGAAQGSLIGVANASSTAGDAARAMGKRMQDQAAAAAEVKKMPPPKEFDVNQALAAGLAGGPAALAADMKAQSDAARAVQDEQQRYMNAYTKSMTDVDGSTPSFGPESIGFKPVDGTSYSSGTSGGPADVSVGEGGPSVSGIGGTVGGLTDGKYGLGNLAVTGSPSTGGVSPLAGDVQNAALQEPLSASGTAQVSTQGTGPGAGAALGTGVLGAGLGFAGARAFGKIGEQGRKNKDERPQEEPEAIAGEQGEDAEGAEVGQHAAAAPGAPGQPAQQPVTGAPQVGQPVATGHPAPQGTPMSMPSAPAFSAPEQPQVPMSAPLAEGATSGAADPSAMAPDHSATASAGNENSGPVSPAAQQAQAFQQQQAQAAGAMAPGMQPMGGGAAGMGGMAGAAGGDAGGGANAQGAQQSASYLIQPDPDDVFGPTEAVTSGVIGEDLEDD